MMCACRTPEESYCKFNSNYSNSIFLITWGEVKNNSAIPPEHRAGPWPLGADHFQLLCQNTLVWCGDGREHTTVQSPHGKFWLQPLIRLSWICPGKGGTKPSLPVSSCSLAVRPTVPLCWGMATAKGGFVAVLSWNPGLLWPLHVLCIPSRMITHLERNFVIKGRMPFWRSNLKKCHFP